jgi:hypothetical protein
VDRRLSNQGIDIDAAPRHFVPYVVRVGMPWKNHVQETGHDQRNL